MLYKHFVLTAVLLLYLFKLRFVSYETNNYNDADVDDDDDDYDDVKCARCRLLNDD